MILTNVIKCFRLKFICRLLLQTDGSSLPLFTVFKQNDHGISADLSFALQTLKHYGELKNNDAASACFL